MDFKTTTLGRTGLKTGRLGIAASYGAPASAVEEAFEAGCNYLYIGSGRKRSQMKQAVKNLVSKGKRDEIVVSLQTYARFGILTEALFTKALKSMNLDCADIMMLGWHNSRPSQKLIDTALAFKEKGLCKFIGISGHNRKLFPKLAAEEIFDVFHIRYNAAHRGAETEIFPQLPTANAPGIVSYTATRWGHLLNQKKMPQNEKPLTAPECYRFALTSPHINICLTGPKNTEQMRQALKALEQGPLTNEEMERIKKIGDHVHEHGGGFF